MSDSETEPPTRKRMRPAAPELNGSKEGMGEKIIHKINRCLRNKKTFYSFEYFPPKTDAGIENLYTRVDRMAMLEPLFVDVTWGAGGSTADVTTEISTSIQNYTSAEVMMHLTCTNMEPDLVRKALQKAKAGGIRNILALRGDAPKGVESWEQCDRGFSHAIDLVRFIRQEYGDFFGIGVAGYPECHASSDSVEKDIQHTKEKIEAGADFVITQLFYDVDLFLTYVQRCREAGLTCPILPGIMPIQNYNGFQRMTSFCKTHVPHHILEALEPIKDDDAAVKDYGVQLGVDMCRRLLNGGAVGLHFFTLNLEKSVISILEGLNFVARKPKGERYLPWEPSKVSRRQTEDVRPIFWANRQRSYLARTATWDEFPNGRWGDSRSPAFGDLSDYHLCNFYTGTKAERQAMWGKDPKTMQDIFAVFEGYIQGTVVRLPWCENALHLETVPLKEMLSRLNRNGFLTINSQPRINGMSSSDPAVGWGGPNGYVYQKAYLEFFVSPNALQKLMGLIHKFPLLSYQAVNSKGEVFGNVDKEKGVNAVTWGVFPCKEIIQPTVVDPKTFLIWKDEAFALWTLQWQSIYEPDSAGFELIQTIYDTWFLVNIVDNDYIHGDIYRVFDELLV